MHPMSPDVMDLDFSFQILILLVGAFFYPHVKFKRECLLYLLFKTLILYYYYY